MFEIHKNKIDCRVTSLSIALDLHKNKLYNYDKIHKNKLYSHVGNKQE